MKTNRVLGRKKENAEKRKEDATQAISVMTNKSIQVTFDYSKLQNLEEEEKVKLMEIEKELIFEGKKLGTIAIEIGKKLLEAREVFIKSHNESFIEWYEQLGFNKDQVSIFINRYQMSIEFPAQKEKIINFSDRMIIQLNKKNTGKDIVEKQNDFKWGESFFINLSKDLTKEFPNIKGFSVTNLKYMKRWYLFWNEFLNRQQGIDDLEKTIFSIHWTQNIILFTKCKTVAEAFFYVQGIVKNGWSKTILTIQIETNLGSGAKIKLI